MKRSQERQGDKALSPRRRERVKRLGSRAGRCQVGTTHGYGTTYTQRRPAGKAGSPLSAAHKDSRRVARNADHMWLLGFQSLGRAWLGAAAPGPGRAGPGAHAYLHQIALQRVQKHTELVGSWTLTSRQPHEVSHLRTTKHCSYHHHHPPHTRPPPPHRHTHTHTRPTSTSTPPHGSQFWTYDSLIIIIIFLNRK